MHVTRDLGRRQIARSFSACFLRRGHAIAGPRRACACACTHGPCGFGPGRCLPSYRLLHELYPPHLRELWPTAFSCLNSRPDHQVSVLTRYQINRSAEVLHLWRNGEWWVRGNSKGLINSNVRHIRKTKGLAKNCEMIINLMKFVSMSQGYTGCLVSSHTLSS
jgi:hypothetical protein